VIPIDLFGGLIQEKVRTYWCWLASGRVNWNIPRKKYSLRQSTAFILSYFTLKF
jgi:hypothetical protein